MNPSETDFPYEPSRARVADYPENRVQKGSPVRPVRPGSPLAEFKANTQPGELVSFIEFARRLAGIGTERELTLRELDRARRAFRAAEAAGIVDYLYGFRRRAEEST